MFPEWNDLLRLYNLIHYSINFYTLHHKKKNYIHNCTASSHRTTNYKIKTYFWVLCDGIYESQGGLWEKSAWTVCDQWGGSSDQRVMREVFNLQHGHRGETWARVWTNQCWKNHLHPLVQHIQHNTTIQRCGKIHLQVKYVVKVSICQCSILQACALYYRIIIITDAFMCT